MAERRSSRPAEYLSLPVNFEDHILMKPIVRGFGDQGLIFALKMCCFLAEQRGFEYEYTETTIKDIADYFEYREQDFRNLFSFAVEKRFFTIEEIEGQEYFRCRFLEEVLLERLFRQRLQKSDYSNRQKEEKKPTEQPQEEPTEEDVGPSGP